MHSEKEKQEKEGIFNYVQKEKYWRLRLKTQPTGPKITFQI